MDIKSFVNAGRKAKQNSEYLKYLKLPIDDKLIVLEAGQGKHCNGNMFALLRCIETDEEWAGYSPIVSVTSSARKSVDKRLKSQGFTKYRLLERDSSGYKKALATAGFLATDNSFPPYFIKRVGQRYLNTWHGIPLKRLGRSDIKNAVSIGNVQKNFLASDYLLFPSEYTRDTMMKDYMIDRVYGGKIIMADYPRNDPLYDEELRARVREKLDLTDKRVAAYMPTWRGAGRSANAEDQIRDAKRVISEIEDALGEDEVLFVNFHFLIGDRINLSEHEGVKMFPEEYETYDFLSACDVLISDYSSVMMDYAGTGRPIIMYMYDYEDYAESKGFYFDIRELPFAKAYDKDELKDALRKALDSDNEPFIRRSAAASDALRTLIKGEDCEGTYQYQTPNDTEIIYAGDLSYKATRMITDDILNRKSAEEKKKTVLAFESNMQKETIDYLESLDDDVEFLRCIYGGSISLREYVYLNLNRNHGLFERKAENYFKREYDRLLRDAKCSEIQFLNSDIYERMGVVASAPKTALHRIPEFFYRRINDVYYNHPENVEKIISQYDRVIDYPSDYRMDVLKGDLCKGIYAKFFGTSQTADEKLRIKARLSVNSPVPLKICTDHAYMGSLVYDDLIPCAARVYSLKENVTSLSDGREIFRYNGHIEITAEFDETVRWYSANVPVIAATLGEEEVHIPVMFDKGEHFRKHKIVRLGNSGKVCETKYGRRYLRFVVKDRNVTDGASERLKLALAFLCHLLSPYKRPVLLYEKNAGGYSESASVLFEKLVDSGYTNARFILDKNSKERTKVGEKYKKYIVDKYSFSHYYNLFAAKSIIASESLAHSLELRSQNFLFNFFVLDGNKDYVFLQHGVMYMVSLDAEQRKFFNKGTGKGKQRVVVSSEREKEHFVNNTDYTDDDIYVCGLLKFDTSVMDADADRIVIMPTWRPWEFVQGSTNIQETGYYKMLLTMVESVPLSLRDRIRVLPHPLIKEQFAAVNDDPVMKYCAKDTGYDDVLRKCRLLITDYSSVSYDAFYRGANVVFYWADKDRCMSEYGRNAHLMLTEDLAFGDVCYDGESLAKSVEARYDTEQPEKYIDNYRQIVSYHDGRNTERFVEMARKDGILL